MFPESHLPSEYETKKIQFIKKKKKKKDYEIFR